MPHNIKSLLVEDLSIRVGDVEIRRLALHRHMPNAEVVDQHQHDFGQWLLYLRGRGIQTVEGERMNVRRGSLVHVAAGEKHGFLKEERRSPICLVVDTRAKDRPQPRLTQLAAAEMSEVERGLHRLQAIQGRPEATAIRMAAGVLDLTARLHEAAARSKSLGGRVHPLTHQIKTWLSEEDLIDLRPGSVAEAFGQSLDSLNRRLRHESGTTVGSLLADQRLDRACELLQESRHSIGGIAAAIGMLDQNYFARWFRQHTGQSPSQWRAG